MKNVFSISLLMLLLLLTGHACGSYWFKVIDVSPISLTPNSETNFTVAVKGLGSSGAYVELVFKNMSEGLSVACPKMIKYVFPAGVTRYNCTLKAGDIAPGNYSFVVDVAAMGSPSGRKTAYVDVLAAMNNQAIGDQLDSVSNEPNLTVSAPQDQPKRTPAPGALLVVILALLACWRMKRRGRGCKSI
jgi:hypothetical protein